LKFQVLLPKDENIIRSQGTFLAGKVADWKSVSWSYSTCRALFLLYKPWKAFVCLKRGSLHATFLCTWAHSLGFWLLPSGQNRQKNRLKECVFVNSALKIQRK